MAEKRTPTYLNECKLSGKVMRPEIKCSANGTTWCTFDLFQSRYQGKDRPPKSSYHHCIAWKDLAIEFMNRVVAGDSVLICGQYWQENYQAKDGSTKQRYQFNVKEFELHKRGDSPKPDPEDDEIPF